jgi:hypothetical protein
MTLLLTDNLQQETIHVGRIYIQDSMDCTDMVYEDGHYMKHAYITEIISCYVIIVRCTACI